MATRLKRLELHGFKSFAAPTTFLFDSGITAIIGPNGSGKSNIADALRWVLGEQSYANLRGRRTEDVIFGGSSTRAPLGMAEVTATLDNESGDLPLAFAEVSITRRAFRSGENHYLINGSRVRLKDVMQATASLGQAHTVIGQGLVDAVLSQRPDERRGLLEHAAGITGLRLKHAEAERHLAESTANSVRLQDLLAEIEPRLRALERAAKQAREFGKVRDQLHTALRRSYAWQWRQATERLELASQLVADCSDQLARLDAELGEAQARCDRAGAQLARRRADHDALEVEARRLQAEQQRLDHTVELLAERRAALVRRRDDLQGSLTSLRDGVASSEQEERGLIEQGRDLRAAIAVLEQRIAELEAAGAAARAKRAELEERTTALRRALNEADQARREIDARLAGIDGTASSLQEQLDGLHQEHAERQARLRQIMADLETACQAEKAHAEQLREACRERDAVRREVERLGEACDAARAEASELQRAQVERSTRLETLQRLQESGAGLHAGVKAVLDAARDGRLAGVVGTLASLLAVPAELEAAIEAAIGGHLQDLVVASWSDAERAIEYLKRTRAGRATFQPLDTVRVFGNRSRPRPAAGIRGLAFDLIRFDPRAEPVVAGLLGRVLVADDLVATRAVLSGLDPGWSVVTVAGEITRASGTVTGGARGRDSGVLARERELRELPDAVAAVGRLLDEARRRVAGLTAEQAGLRARLTAAEREVSRLQEEVRSVASTRERLERWRDELVQAAESEQTRAAKLAARLESLACERADLVASTEALDARRVDLDAEWRRLTAERQAEQAAADDGRLREARVERRGLLERLHGLEAQLERLRSRRQDQARQARDAEARLAVLADETAALDGEQRDLARQAADSAARLSEARERSTALRRDLDQATAAERDARRALEEVSGRLRGLERERDRLELERARRTDELELLRERAGRDLEVDDAEPLIAVEPAPDTTDPAALDQDIARLRERLRRIGLVGDDAIEQYEREAERYTFLRRQLDDLDAATQALRALMAELDRTMARELDRTFAEVGQAFEETFGALFGGGKARLVPSTEAEMLSGIDILAQPPGKRLQNLALLSGGERALTAVALLFAILKVNPSPFCLLDEVDAALDESNVVRVRDELRRLAARTQFVIVTHNRATIEGADTLYGVTMGDDGLSRVLSLRLPAQAPV